MRAVAHAGPESPVVEERAVEAEAVVAVGPGVVPRVHRPRVVEGFVAPVVEGAQGEVVVPEESPRLDLSVPHAEPSIEALGVGGEADVIDLEELGDLRRPDRCGPVLAAPLLDLEPPIPTTQGRLRRVHREACGVRALQVVRGGALDTLHGLGGACDVAAGEEPPDGIVAIVPLVLESDAAIEGVRREPVECTVAREVTVHGRDHAPNLRLPVVDILSDAHHPEVGSGLHEEVLAGIAFEDASAELISRDGRECAEGQPTLGAAGKLRRAEDRGVVGDIGVEGIPRRPTVRRAPDPAAVEQCVLPSWEAEVEDAGVLDEEGTLLGEEGLEGGEIDDRRVRLHLPEVGVDAGVEGEGRAQTVAQVHPDAGALGGPVEEGISGLGWPIVVGGDEVRQKLQAAGRTAYLHVLQAAHLAHDPLPKARNQAVVAPLVVGHAEAVEVDPPRLDIVRRFVPDLREGNPDLRAPSLVVDADGRAPHGVPGAVHLIVAVEVRVALHVGGAHPEAVARQPIEVGIEVDAELVVGALVVSPGEASVDGAGFAVPHPRGDPDGFVAEEDPYLGVVLGSHPLHRLTLGEAGEDAGVGPVGLVGDTVDPDVGQIGEGIEDSSLRRTRTLGRRRGDGGRRLEEHGLVVGVDLGRKGSRQKSGAEKEEGQKARCVSSDHG